MTPRRFRKLAKSVYREQDKSDFKVFNKLQKKLIESPPNLNDIKILSQAIYFKKIFEKEIKTQMFLASTDYHFSEIRDLKDSMGLCNIIPKEIHRRFCIISDWPDNILKRIKAS